MTKLIDLQLKEIPFSEVADGQVFYINKSKRVKGKLGSAWGGWYGKNFCSWKFVEDKKIVKVEITC
jgi:hypothetical protein